MFSDPRKNFRDDMVEREGVLEVVFITFKPLAFWGVDQGRFGGDLRCVWSCEARDCARSGLGYRGVGDRVLRIGLGGMFV